MEDQPEDNYFSDETATFGDRVQAARMAVGLSDEDFAKKLGVKLKTVRGWEEDLAEPRANKLQMMAGLTNVSIMWLLTGDGQGLSEPSSDVDITDDAQAILLDLRQTRAQLMAMTQKMALLEKRLGRILGHE